MSRNGWLLAVILCLSAIAFGQTDKDEDFISPVRPTVSESDYHFVGKYGALRAGQPIAEFEDLYDEFTRKINPIKQALMANKIDKFVYDEALALFLCSPQALYAVNKEVDFTAYATTFELAECEVSKNHWSRKK